MKNKGAQAEAVYTVYMYQWEVKNKVASRL